MPKTLNEIFDEANQEVLSKWAAMDQAAKDAAVEALKKSSQAFYQHIVNLGFGAAQAQHTEDTTRLKNEKKSAEDRATAAEAKLREQQDKTPDVAAINKQWEEKLEQTRTDERKKLQNSESRINRLLQGRDQAGYKAELIARKVPPAVAEILSKDPELWNDRSTWDDEGSLSVRQAGAKIPLSPANGQTVLGLVADEAVAKLDPAILLSDVDTGSGLTGSDSGRSGGGNRAFYDGLRKKVQDSQKVESGEDSRPLRERVGGR